MTPLRGVIHGKTIELAEAPDLPEGQAVHVIVCPVLAPGEGLRRSAGAWGDDKEELDAWLEEMHRLRKMDRRGPDA